MYAVAAPPVCCSVALTRNLVIYGNVVYDYGAVQLSNTIKLGYNLPTCYSVCALCGQQHLTLPTCCSVVLMTLLFMAMCPVPMAQCSYQYLSRLTTTHTNASDSCHIRTAASNTINVLQCGVAGEPRHLWQCTWCLWRSSAAVNHH